MVAQEIAMTKELCYKIEVLPDLTLNKYASLEENGVEGVLEKHLAFLRQWNRMGLMHGISLHLLYYYDGVSVAEGCSAAQNGNKMEVLFLVRGKEERMLIVAKLVEASALSPYFRFSSYSVNEFMTDRAIEKSRFKAVSALIKKEILVKPAVDSPSNLDGYYTVSAWETSENGRLYNMMKLMESLDRRALYRIDLYPVERSESLRNALHKPMRELQKRRMSGVDSRDYEADAVIRDYEALLKNFDESPHFIVNAFVYGENDSDTTAILDAAGAEAIQKGSYNIATFFGDFTPLSFFGDAQGQEELIDYDSKTVLRWEARGASICKEDYQKFTLRQLTVLWTLEEVAPFFRFPALYEGEVIQKRKETAPKPEGEDGLFLGKGDNRYEVYCPLNNLQKHAFISGVPGSGKTNTMHHITSTLWKKHKIPFLVLEPAKQEYRALLNQPGMEDLYLFSPNADMTFPIHINPFEFPKGLMLSEHINRLDAVFEGAFPLFPPMPFLLDSAIEKVYRACGWEPDMVNDGDRKHPYPTMKMLYDQLEKEVDATEYEGEIRGNLQGALEMRIGSLLRREIGDVFNVPRSTIPPEEWIHIPAVIELESMGTGPANFMTLMLCTLIRETLKVHPKYEKNTARHVIFIEEAHNLIGPEAQEVSGEDASPKLAATAYIVKMLAEVRALNESIFIADQLPTAMAQEVLKNTGMKIALRLTSADDRAMLGSTMAAGGAQMEEMATFNVGRSLISYEGLMKPFTMQMQEWRGSGTEDGIENPESRRTAVTPLPDEELRETIKDRGTFRRTVYESFRIKLEQIGLRLAEAILGAQEGTKYFDHWRTAISGYLEQAKSDNDVIETRWEHGEISDHERVEQDSIFANRLVSLQREMRDESSLPDVVDKVGTAIELSTETIKFYRRYRSKAGARFDEFSENSGADKIVQGVYLLLYSTLDLYDTAATVMNELIEHPEYPDQLQRAIILLQKDTGVQSEVR
jgi:hypothetical protein